MNSCLPKKLNREKKEDDFLLPEIKRDDTMGNTNESEKKKQKTTAGSNKKRGQGGSKKNSKKKHADRNSVVLALSTIGIIIIAAAVILFFMISPSSAAVPQLTNMSLEDARSTAEESGYTISDEIEYSLSDTVQENYVISQLPEAGTEAPKSEPIKLVVSLGTSGGGIEVPNVVNKAVDKAGEMIEDLTLTYRVVSEYSDTVESGIVIRQTPLAGTHINSGDIVTLHVSIGPDTNTGEKRQVRVPNVLGMYRDNAESTLGEYGLGIGTVTYMPSDQEEGTIVMQSPAEGAMVEEASSVTIVLSSGSTDTTLGSEYRESIGTETGETENGGEEVSSGENENDESSGETSSAGEEPVGDSGSDTASSEETSSGGGDSSETSGSNTSGSGASQIFSVKIPDAANDSVNVEIVANGQVVHNAMHSKTEGTVSVEIPDDGSGSASVQAYIDGAKVSDKTITF